MIDDQVGAAVWGVPYFGEAGAPIAVPDTVCFEGGPVCSSPPGCFVGGVGVAALGVVVLGALGAVFCGVSADDAGAYWHDRSARLTQL